MPSFKIVQSGAKETTTQTVGLLGDKLMLLLRLMPAMLHTFDISNEWLLTLLPTGMSVWHVGEKM